MAPDRAAARVAALALALLAAPAAADFDADAFPPYERCALCHGLFGVSGMARFPHLGGQDPVYLEAQIRAFLAGERTNDGGQMAAVVTELAAEDIPVVVAWFAAQDPPEATPAASSGGAALYLQAGCGACHDRAADLDGVPFLSAQHAGYLAKQMRDFRDGRRGPGRQEVPHRAMLPADDADIDALAEYLAAEPR